MRPEWPITRLFSLRLLILLLPITFGAGCNPLVDEQVAHFPAGHHPFHFDRSAVDHLDLNKSDPATGDHWLARLQKKGADWVLLSGPDGAPLVDSRADTKFVNHLLDSLPTLEVDSEAPHGAPESFGLEPPVFALRFTLNSGESSELRVGAPGKTGTYTQFPVLGGLAGLEGGNTVYAAKGAALKMLEFIEKFEALRLRVFAAIDADDVYELEWFDGKKPRLYAQRDGARWSDRRHRPIRDIGALLEGISHIRILRFVDDPAAALRIVQLMDTTADHQVILSDRQGHPTRLSVKRIAGELYGTTSARPGAAFVLYPESIRFF